MISSRFGSLVQFDKDTALKRNLNRARVLNKTPLSLSHIPQFEIAVKVNGKLFHIKINEEVDYAAADLSGEPFLLIENPVAAMIDDNQSQFEGRVLEKSTNLNLSPVPKTNCEAVPVDPAIGIEKSYRISRRARAYAADNDLLSSNGQTLGPTGNSEQIHSKKSDSEFWPPLLGLCWAQTFLWTLISLCKLISQS